MLLSIIAFRSAVLISSLFCLLTVGEARADYRIIKSNVPQLKAGTVLPDQAKLIIPEGGRVTVLRSGKTKTIDGPFEGFVSEGHPRGNETSAPSDREMPAGTREPNKD